MLFGFSLRGKHNQQLCRMTTPYWSTRDRDRLDQPVEFEGDPEKAEENLRSHGVVFTEAKTVFEDPLEVTIPEPTTRMWSSDS